jgi:hypothetical protein
MHELTGTDAALNRAVILSVTLSIPPQQHKLYVMQQHKE